LGEALKAGLGVEEFWAQTLRETALVIQTAAWRWERDREGEIRLAWYMAML